MPWTVLLHPAFAEELVGFSDEVQDEIAVLTGLLHQFGPQLRRPHCDTLNGSAYANMKELRFDAAGGVWRIAFAFDPQRRAVLLVGGDKSGVNQRRFYNALIKKADERFRDWLET